MSEPTIYKPSIYNGNGVYNNGASGGGGVDPEKDVFVGGELYEGIEIDGRIWINRNLNFIPNDVYLNPANLMDGNPNCAYYNKQASEPHEDFGLLYNFNAVQKVDSFIQNSFPGWRVATQTDLMALVNTYGDQYTAGLKLKSTDCGGDNESGFTFIMSGCVDANGNFTNLDQYGFCWTSTEVGSYSYAFSAYRYDNGFGRLQEFRQSYFPIRLCKNV